MIDAPRPGLRPLQQVWVRGEVAVRVFGLWTMWWFARLAGSMVRLGARAALDRVSRASAEEPHDFCDPDHADRPGCRLCPDNAPRSPEQMLYHLQFEHPDVYGDGPDRWPDGSVVVIDLTLTPDDFGDG